MATMERISAVKYSTEQGGIVTLTPAGGGGWNVEDGNTGRTEHFDSIPGFMAYCGTNYSWPMSTASVVD